MGRLRRFAEGAVAASPDMNAPQRLAPQSLRATFGSKSCGEVIPHRQLPPKNPSPHSHWRDPQVLFTHDTAEWLDEVDPWSDQEALDLLDAVRNCRTQGLFHCSSSADGSVHFVMTAHATGVLVLATRDAWQAFALEIARRCGLAAVSPSDPARKLASRLVGSRPRNAANAA